MSSRIAAVQFKAGPNAGLDANLNRAMDVLQEKAADADVVCLPEYFATSYFPAKQDPDKFDLAVSENSSFVDHICKTAADIDTAVIAPIFEKGMPGGRYYNTALIIDADGKIVGKYRKLHPFQRPGYNETYYFSPGDLGAPVFDVGGLTIGIMICYDRHYPEIARVEALRGAEVIFVPTCSFGEENRDAVWVKELTGIAVANSTYVVGVNRAGTERDQTHFGASTVIDPTGKEIDTLGIDPSTLTAEVFPSTVTKVRNRTKHLNDIRHELLADFDLL